MIVILCNRNRKYRWTRIMASIAERRIEFKFWFQEYQRKIPLGTIMCRWAKSV